VKSENRKVKTAAPEPERDTPMTGRYVKVIVLQVVILVLLWIFGRMFS
jgi:hypothetical protein